MVHVALGGSQLREGSRSSFGKRFCVELVIGFPISLVISFLLGFVISLLVSLVIRFL